MSELHELQRRVASAIMHPLTKDETMRLRRSDGVSNRVEADLMIKPNDRLTAFERLEIYNRQYWFRLYSSFEEDFPGLKAILGSSKFEKLMRAYLVDNPSASFTLRNLGSRLEAWLILNPKWIEPDRDLALSMARLEWAHIEAFDAAEDSVLTSEELAGINEDTRLRLQPYLRILALSYPVDDLLIAARSNSGSQNVATNNAAKAPENKSAFRIKNAAPEQVYLAVHRQQNSVYYKRLLREEFRLLELLLSGQDLGSAIENAMNETAMTEEAFHQMLESAFATWSMLGWFSADERRSL